MIETYLILSQLLLEMHIGHGSKASKNKLIFSPLRYLGYNIIDPNVREKNQSLTVIKRESLSNKYKQEELEYNNLTVTESITVADEVVTSCPHFKYLGS